MLDNVDAMLVPEGFEEFVSLYKTSANARDKKRRAEFLLQPIAFPDSWSRARECLGIEQPLPKLTFGELVSLVTFSSDRDKFYVRFNFCRSRTRV
jgi:hypothetical protein